MPMSNLLPTLRLYFIEIPATLLLAPLGFMLELVVTLPFILICELDGFFRKRN